MQTTHDPVWFSNHYRLGRLQFQLPFVDIDLDGDVPLYIDPYAISRIDTRLAIACHTAIVSYFQTLLSAVQRGDLDAVDQLVRRHMSEAREYHLGVSTLPRRGRGIGAFQAAQIVRALGQSQAAKIGYIGAIHELELHIDGVGPDKISDLTGNIIKGYLANYTDSICREYGIPTRPCAIDEFWNPGTLDWDSGHFNLPTREDVCYILVPKAFVRRDEDLANHVKFYNGYMLEYLTRELATAGDSLARALRTRPGEHRVYRIDVRRDPRFRMTKANISKFIMEHPRIMDQYRADVDKSFKPTDPAVLSGKARSDDRVIEETLEETKRLPPGRKGANTYHRDIEILISFVFDWALSNFESEYVMDQGRGRIDIVCDNHSPGGFFSLIRDRFVATTIPMECKNYADDLGNDEYNQICDRLGPKTSQLGMMFCRSVIDRDKALQHRTDRWLRRDTLVLLFDDEDVAKLVGLRLARDFEGIERMLRDQLRAVQYGNPQKGNQRSSPWGK